MQNADAITITRADYAGNGTTSAGEDYAADRTWTTSAGYIPALTAKELRLIVTMSADEMALFTLDADGVTNFDYDYRRTLAD